MSYKNLIQGPVIPIPTPFLENEEIDYNGLSSYTKFLSDENIPAVMTTVGTSRYNLLSWDEIKKVNETIVKASGPNTQTIVANPTTGGLKAAIEFGKHAESLGADYYIVYFPERHYGEDNTYNYFKALCDELSIKILIHEMPMRNGIAGGSIQYSVNLLETLFQLENIVGMKEEALNAEYSNELVEKFSEDVLIIGAGGGMSRYMYRDYERGAQAYLGGIGNFIPKIELDFYQAITNGNQEKAKAIVENVELKYFEKVVPLGWHPSLKIALNLKGLTTPFERRPMKQFSDIEKQQMEAIFKEFGWL
jgi:dihydrodipicolinate synthase/N-acetylneuraminate lyase